MVVLQVGKKIQCESYRSINEAAAKLSFAVRLEYRQVYVVSAELWEFSSSVQLDISRVSPANELDIDLNTKREIPYLQASMYYFVYYINTLLTRRSRFH